MKKKIGRNDPCPCGSGKKFKKCCESKMIGKKFMATQISTGSMINKAKNLSSLFNRSCAPVKEELEKTEDLSQHSIKVKKEEKKTEEPQENKEKKDNLEEKNKNS